MGGPLIVLFILEAIVVIIYAAALEWADRHDKFTATDFTMDKVILGEAICIGFPMLYYLGLLFFWPAYGDLWPGPWTAVREVIFVIAVCQMIGGMIIWIWQRWKRQRFYEEE